MSSKSAEQFFEKVAQNKTLQAKLKALHKKTLIAVKAANAGVVKLAAAAGFKITAKDLVAAPGAKSPKAPKGQLREVAGQGINCSGHIYNYCTNQDWTCVYGSWY